MTEKRELNLDITPAVELALGALLELLHHYGSRKGVPVKALAWKLWPRSPGWVNAKELSLKQKGKGPVYAATNMAVRLKRMGLAEDADAGIRLTGKGLHESLDASRKAAEKAARIAARKKT